MVASSLYVVDFFYLLFPFSFIIISSPSFSLSQTDWVLHRMVSVNLDYASSSANAWRGTQVDHSAAFEYIAQYSITTTLGLSISQYSITITLLHLS